MNLFYCFITFLIGFIIGGMVVKITPPPKFFLVLLTKKTRRIVLIIPGQSKADCWVKLKNLYHGDHVPEHGTLEMYDQTETKI